VTGGRREDRRDSRDDVGRSHEETRKPKLTSALGAHNPVPVVGEKPKPSLDTSSAEMKSRNKKMFGVLVGTLQTFKSQIQKKTEAEQRRDELEQKVQQRVKEEQENIREEQRRAVTEQKAKELALREEIRQQQEQKELELLNLKWDNHRNQLSAYLKTEAKPSIYYKPAKNDPSHKSGELKSSTETHNVQTKE